MENQEKFIKEKYWDREEFREATKQAAKRIEMREHKQVPDEPEARIENYLRRFTDIFKRKDEEERAHGIEAIKRLLHRKYIIKPENISDEYIKGILLGNFAEQKGYNYSDLKNPDIRQSILEQFRHEYGQSFESYTIPEKERERVREMVIKDQEARLDSWFSYLTSPEAENIPAAYRYWAFAEMLKLGSYDDDRKVYNKRTETTAAPFPELDQQALALVLDEIRRKQKGEPSALLLADEQSQAEFNKRLQSENFGKLYAFTQEHLKSLRLPTERLIITDGKWRIFPQGSDPKEVVKALSGFHTQWCIAGEGAAANYLSHSNLHIYFSKDAEGKDIIPRACIVNSKNHGITEVRGIMSDETAKQHLDDYITPVVEKHLSSMPGGEKWQNQMQDMKRLAAIHIKYKRQEELSKEDLRFLYEIDRKIHTTGYDRDPRITEILKKRDIKGDLAFIFGVSKDQISTTKKEALRGNIKYHYEDLDLRDLTSAKDLKLPESIEGSLDLSGLTSTEGLKLPKSVNGDLNLSGLKSAKGLELPESIGGSLYLGGLISAKGLELPELVGGHLDLKSLKSAKGLKLPKSVNGDLNLSSLKSAEGLELPELVGEILNLSDLTSAKGLKLPKSVGGVIYLSGLTSAEKNNLRKQYPHFNFHFF